MFVCGVDGATTREMNVLSDRLSTTRPASCTRDSLVRPKIKKREPRQKRDSTIVHYVQRQTSHPHPKPQRSAPHSPTKMCSKDTPNINTHTTQTQKPEDDNETVAKFWKTTKIFCGGGGGGGGGGCGCGCFGTGTLLKHTHSTTHTVGSSSWDDSTGIPSRPRDTLAIFLEVFVVLDQLDS